MKNPHLDYTLFKGFTYDPVILNKIHNPPDVQKAYLSVNGNPLKEKKEFLEDGMRHHVHDEI